MTEIIIPFTFAVAGFVAGALVYRKHTKEAERVIKQLQDVNTGLRKRLEDKKK